MKPDQRLKAWEKARERAVAINRETRSFPKDERYEPTSQIRRASCSIAANLVEGSGQCGSREFARFLDIALGSMIEVTYALEFAHAVGYLTEEKYGTIEALRNEAGVLLWRLYQEVRKDAGN